MLAALLRADLSTSSVQCSDGKSYDVTPDIVTIESVTVTEHGKAVPTVNADLQ